MKKLATTLGIWGATLGMLAGLIELGIGSQIRPWIGNKENPAILGGQPGRGYLSNQAAISARTWLKLG